MLLPRTFTVSEANALVPFLEGGIRRARRAMARAHALRGQLMRKALESRPQGDVELASLDPDAAAAMEQAGEEAREELAQLALLGVLVPRLAPATARVLAKRGIDTAVLCWDEGQEAFTRWHLLGEPEELSRPIVDEASFGGPPLVH